MQLEYEDGDQCYWTYQHLATVHKAEGGLDQALVFGERVLAIKKKTLGGEHPDVTASYSNLARERPCDTRQPPRRHRLRHQGGVHLHKTLGVEHPHTAQAQGILTDLQAT